MKRIKFLLLLLLCLPVLACNANEDDNEAIQINGLTIQNFPVIDGSDSTLPLRMILMCRLFGFDYHWQGSPFLQDPNWGPKYVIAHYTCTDEEQQHLKQHCLKQYNTHQSFINLIDNTVELILTARSISRDEKAYAEEQGVTLIEKPIAKDALTFMIHPQNPVNSLSIPQIQGIYTGEITNWKEVGGADVAIVPYVRNRNSGSQEKFETMVMAGLTIKDFPELQIGVTMMTPYYQIEGEANGIAFTPFYYFSVIVGNGKTKGLAVNGVAMNKENIMNNTYPYISDVYAAVRSDVDKSSMAYKLFEFLTTPGGQSIIEESGYIPLAAYSGVKNLREGEVNIAYYNQTISVHSPCTPTHIQITDLNGRVILQKEMTTNEVKLSSIPKGFYIVKVTFSKDDICISKMEL